MLDTLILHLAVVRQALGRERPVGHQADVDRDVSKAAIGPYRDGQLILAALDDLPLVNRDKLSPVRREELRQQAGEGLQFTLPLIGRGGIYCLQREKSRAGI